MNIYQITLVQGRILNKTMTTSIRFFYKTLETCKVKPEHFHPLFQNDFISQYKGKIIYSLSRLPPWHITFRTI